MTYRSGAETDYKDLREWLQRVEGLGEIKTIRGADWNLETGAISDIVYEETKDIPPALLFDNIKGYPPGYRQLFGALGSVKRIALPLGMPLDYPCLMDFVKAYREKIREVRLIPPRFVATGPVMENVDRGKGVDLLKFPAPWIHELDGGRYFGTAHIVVTKDPDREWINFGTYRMMLHDRNSLGFYITPGKHGRIHRDTYFERKQPCPVVVAVGTDPLIWMVSSTEVPMGVSEYEYAGGLKGSPIDVIKGPVTGLPIPATAEIALEGYSYPDERRDEGPFGEWTNYYAGWGRPEPVLKVEAVYHRTDPILTATTSKRGPSDVSLHPTLVRSALTWDELENAGVPDVKGVWRHPAGGSRLFTIVSIKQRYPGHARQAGIIASQTRAGAYMGRFILVVDDDIDPSNTEEVLWAMSTRTDPSADIDIIRKCWGSKLDPILPRDAKAYYNSRAIIDACKPFDWMQEFPPVVQTSPELMARLKTKFGDIISTSIR
ncbi:MAG: UbiD family decarboxylase [Chloroflexi bacterium]|nr:UbiD family decarboxylase [Chloroflexota bacterium]